VPGRTSCNLEAATTLRIAEECPNVVGIKEASGMMKQILQLLAKRPEDFMVISGDDLLTLPLMAAGADGLISVMANAFPKKVADMVHHIMANRLDDARTIHQQLVPLTVDCFKEGSPAGVKAIMSAQGLTDNVLRLPLVPVSEKLQEEIQRLLTVGC
jgi:4-hydroxy-tetrahydrodipicolinate synthase